MHYSITNKTEIIDLINEDLTCNDLAEFPIDIMGASVSLMDSSPVICGGALFYKATNQCYILNNGTWNLFGNMKDKRYSASSLQLDKSSFQLFGGYDLDAGSFLNTTEVVFSNGSAIYGPTMPFPLRKFAIGKINETMSLIIGGQTCHDYSDLTWYYDQVNQTFKPGPTLLKGRICHTAGIVRDQITNQEFVVVVGGQDSNGIMNSIEMLINGEWEIGKQEN